MPRSFDNAYFDNEKGDPVSGSTVFLNKFKQPTSGAVNVNLNLQNYLDPAVRSQRQPQSIPAAAQGQTSLYAIFIGSKALKKIKDAVAAKQSLPEMKITLLFGVGLDLDNLGLRFFFEQVDDRILINVPGEEAPRWNIGITGLVDTARGITVNQIESLVSQAMSVANVSSANPPFQIKTLAAYSTGFGSLNQTVNEGLIPLNNIDTVVYFDCTYRADGPPAVPADGPAPLKPSETNPGPDEVDRSHNNSAFNTQRALKRIIGAAGRGLTIAGYMATTAGSPRYLRPTVATGNQYTVDFPSKIDLRANAPGSSVSFRESLFALVLTRCLAFARLDGQIRSTDVPRVFSELEAVLPARGQVASSTATLRAKTGFSPTTTLLDWGRANSAKVKLAQSQVAPAVKLISDHELMYPAPPGSSISYPSPGNEEGALHAALLPEFGWEFLL